MPTYTPSADALAHVTRILEPAVAAGMRVPEGVVRFNTEDIAQRAEDLTTTGSCLIDWSPGDMTRYVLTVVDLRANVLGGRYAVANLQNRTSITIDLESLGDVHNARTYLTDNVASATVLAIYFTFLADAVDQLTNA